MIHAKYEILNPKQEEAEAASQELARVLETYLQPLLCYLDRWLDKRLLRTLVGCCVAILRFRNPKQGLVLAQLGAYLSSYSGLSQSAAAGTKRVGNLIRSWKWNAGQIEQFLLQEANTEVERLRKAGKRILALVDGSVVEKPESTSLEATAPAISSKAKRWARSRFGLLFNPPLVRPLRVIGMEWTGSIITGLEGIPHLAVMRFWTTKGAYAHKLREMEEEVVRKLVRTFGPGLTFIFDRGYASGPWLLVLQKYRVNFVIRWIKKHVFYTTAGQEKKLWEVGFGKRYLAHRLLRETHSGLQVVCDLWWGAVRHPQYDGTLFLIRARVQGKKVMYLITNEPIKTEEQAWEIFSSYKRRWQIETSFRYAKCELALESPRVWSYEDRLKLFSIVLVVYAFLLFFLDDIHDDLRQRILHLKAHRTGKRYEEALVPLYLLREAISHLWNDARPLLGWLFPPDLATIQVLAFFHPSNGS